jgi:hypothetical protein
MPATHAVRVLRAGAGVISTGPASGAGGDAGPQVAAGQRFMGNRGAGPSTRQPFDGGLRILDGLCDPAAGFLDIGGAHILGRNASININGHPPSTPTYALLEGHDDGNA